MLRIPYHPSPRRQGPARETREASSVSVPAGSCLIVSYHYVRDPADTPFPSLRTLHPARFVTQLADLQASCRMLDYGAFRALIAGDPPPERPGALLTFDDGLLDHFTHVFPALVQQRLHGIFFVSPVNTARPSRVLNVQKAQLLLAGLGGERLLAAVEAFLARVAPGHPRERPHPVLYRYDPPADRQVKQLLNYELRYELADDLLDELFRTHIGPEPEVAPTLYMTDAMIREMSAAGMTFGFHTRNHRVLSRLGPADQRAELEEGVDWIRSLTGQDSVPFCYPHGHAHAYTADTVAAADSLGYSMAFTAVRALAHPVDHPRFEFPRYDTCDVPSALDLLSGRAPASASGRTVR